MTILRWANRGSSTLQRARFDEGRVITQGSSNPCFINDLERQVGTSLLGRRMHEVMSFWDSEQAVVDERAYIQEFAAIWRAADKIVYSRTLQAVATSRTRLERNFDPETVRAIKEAAARDLSVGGADLAAQAFQSGLVDECHFFLAPISIGGGRNALPLDLRVRLELLAQHRFRSGAAYLHYRVAL